jgi:hypothetical protein
MRHECYGGSGYLSQSTNDLFLPATRATAIARIEVRWPDGVETSISNPQIENGRISIQPQIAPADARPGREVSRPRVSADPR